MVKAIIDLKQILQNVERIKKESNKDIIVCVKSNAYNFGAVEVVKYLSEHKIDYFAVVETKEAKELTNANIKSNILILNSVYQEDLEYVNKNENIILTINSISDALMIAKYQFTRIVKVHLQIETGMNRLGIKTLEEEKEILRILPKNIGVEGIYTHYSSLKALKNQESKFSKFLIQDFKMVHGCATPTYKYGQIGNYVRVGMDVYGDDENTLALKIQTKPIAINEVEKGKTVGYNEAFEAKDKSRIAVLPIGYNNGFIRKLTNSLLFANNKYYKVVGNVCMNHIFVLVDEDVTINTTFDILSKNINAKMYAEYLDTIPYEILCMFRIDSRGYLR